MAKYVLPGCHSLSSPHGKTIENFSKVRQREPFHTAHTTASSQEQTKNSSVALQHKALSTTSITTTHQSQQQNWKGFSQI